MMQGLMSAMRAIIFGTVLLAVALTAWAIVAVELLQPKVKELEERDFFPNCPRCSRSFDSVSNAILTFVSGIVAGDSWGKVNVPLMEEYWWSTFILIPAFLSIEMGLLNVIA